MPKILAIDDINDNLISLKAIISDAFPGAVVFTALNGPKGIELAIDCNPDVILLDVIMPGMDGFEVCRQLKQDERVSDIPVVFLTAIKGDKESRIKALEVGAEGFLSKPIDETELIAQIRAMVKIKTANEQKRSENARLVKLVNERTRELQDELDERKKAEELLLESEYFFKESQRAAFVGSYKFDLRTDFWTSSEVLEQIFGIDKSYNRSLGGWLEIAHPEDREMMARYFSEEVVSKRNPFNKEYRIIRKSDGETRWVLGLGKLTLDADDNIVEMIGTIQDITDRKESEIALQESEERYRRFISQVSEGVYRFESDEPMDTSLPLEEQIDYIYNHMLIAECNNAFLKMYGYTDENEMLGKSHLDFHGGRNNKLNREALRRFINNGYRIENALTEELTAVGQKLYFINNLVGIFENNKLTRMWGTQSDVTARIRADQVQQVLYSISNAALSSIDLSELIEFISKEIGKLLDSTNFYIAFYDEETNMLSMLYERDEKDVLGSWPAEKSITGYVIRHQKSMRLTYEDVKKLCDAGEIEIFGTPSEVWLGVPLVMNKKVIGALVVQNYNDPEAYTEQDKLMLEFISHQISISIERKKAEQELNEALVKAQESDRLKSSFLANMSHEIRTPLNSIIGFSELMCDPDSDLSQHLDFSRMINSSGNNLLTIITDILDLSKIEAGQVVLRKKPVSVNELIKDIHKEYSFMAGKKGIRLEMDLSEIDEQVEIESDESALRKILINFVGNAIKFTTEGFIEIGVRPVGKYLQFHVKDTGIGIPSEFHKTIFERFCQIESFSTRKYGGNGLGLAISKSLVELLRGKIWMESESGVGSTFYFAVPLEENK